MKKNQESKDSDITVSMTLVMAVLLLLSTAIVVINSMQLVHAQNATSSNTTTTTPPISAEVNTSRTLGAVIPNQWIVTLRDNVTTEPQAAQNSVAALSDEAESLGVQVTSSLPQAGVVVLQTPPNMLAALADIEEDPNVLTVEPNRVQGIFGQTIPTGIDRADAERGRTLPSGNGTTSPVNATIAIIDTGIALDHPDLNVYRNVSFVGTPTGNDDQGHGTHVAGIAAAKNDSIGVVGVAPGAKLVAVKVLDRNGFGSTASVLAGIDYVIAHANETDVANLSLGGGFSVAENRAIARAVANGVTMVVAAGNEDVDASTVSPASAPDAITVSAIVDTDGKCGGLGPGVTMWGVENPDDSFAIYSNWGEVIDISAPGTRINSTVPIALNPTGYDASYTGTSMAAPHVAGAAALYKSVHNNALPDQVRDAILSLASTSTTKCDGNGHGYLGDRTLDDDNVAEPLLYVKDLG